MIRIKQFLESERLYIVELLFKVVYILHLLVSFNPYIDGTPVTKVTLVLTMALGGFLALCRVLSFAQYRHTPGILFLVLFIVSFVIPSVFIYRYAFVDSVKTIIWMTFQFGILFAFNSKKDASLVKKELFTVSFATMTVVTIENIVSVIMAFTGYFRIYQKIDGSYAVTGLSWWGRLYGVHGDPNYACVYTIAAIMIAVYLFFKCRNKWLRLMLVVFSVFNFMFISFTASRTGLISLVIAAVVFAFTYFISDSKKKYRLLKSITSVVAAVVLLLCLNKLTIGSFNALKSLPTKDDSVATQDSSNDQNTQQDTPKEDEQNAPTVGRTEEELGGDITNRRSDIWGSALQIFAKNPVFGIGFENVLGYAHDKMPTTYIVNNDQTDFDAFHNTVMDILVSQGAVGIVLICIFVVIFIVYFIRRIGKKSGENRVELSMCLAICVSTIASAMFLSHIFYVNIATTGIFWLFAGYLGHLLYVNE